MKFINIENILFKVTCHNDDIVTDKNKWYINYIPRNKRVEMTCTLINDSKLFEYVDKSRIDNAPIYRISNNTIRSIKINKIKNKDNNLSKIVFKLFNQIEDKIELINGYPI